jgi:hypothetical protein
LAVVNPYTWDSDTNGSFNPASTATFNVQKYGATGNGSTDDTGAIQAAYNDAVSYRNAGGHPTLYFPAGIYMMSYGIGINSNIRFMGDGMSSTILRCNANWNKPGNLGSGMGLLWVSTGGDVPNVAVQNLTLDGNGYYQSGGGGLINLSVGGNVINLNLTDVHFLELDPNTSCASLTSVVGLYVTNCEFSGGNLFMFQGSKQAISGCSFYPSNNVEESVHPRGISNFSVTGCTCQDYDLTAPAQGNFIASNADYGTESNVYIADNNTVLGPAPGGNSGAAVISEGADIRWQCNPAAATPTTVTLSTVNQSGTFPHDNEFNDGMTAIVAGGKGLGQYRVITSYDGGSNTITVSPAWNVVPDNTNLVLIGRATDKWAFYHNTFQGKSYYATVYTGMSGIQPDGGAYEWICDNNTITQMRGGLYFGASEGTSLGGGCYFNYCTNNIINSCYEGIGVGFTAPLAEIEFLGNVFRNNVISDITTDGAYEGTPGAVTFPSFDLTLFEHNTFNNLPYGFDCAGNRAFALLGPPNSNQDALTINTLLYKNAFNLGTAAYAGSFGINFGTNTLSPALNGNTWTGFATTYSGALPGTILDMPIGNFAVPGITGGGPQTVTLPLWNSGTAPLVWTAVSDSSWLTVSSGNGTVADQDSTSAITLTCNPAGLAPGTYIGTITIVGGSEPETVPVTFTVSPPTPVPVMPAWAFLTVGTILFALLGEATRKSQTPKY